MKLKEVARTMHARWQLAAESGNDEPHVNADWLSAAVRPGSDAAAKAGGGELEQHMLAHVSGIGPSLFKVHRVICIMRPLVHAV